jgi:hypothetical protein
MSNEGMIDDYNFWFQRNAKTGGGKWRSENLQIESSSVFCQFFGSLIAFTQSQNG